MSAHDYVKAYYGETIETCSPYYTENVKKDETPQGVVDHFAKENMKQAEQLSKFKLLTPTELCKMFPLIAEDIRETNKNYQTMMDKLFEIANKKEFA